MKTCSKCGVEKLESEYYRSKGYLRPCCKKCWHQMTQKNYRDNRDARNEKSRLYYYSHKDKAIHTTTAGTTHKTCFNYYKKWSSIRYNEKKRHSRELQMTLEEFANWWNSSADECEYCGLSTFEYRSLLEKMQSYAGSSSTIKYAISRPNLIHTRTVYLTIDRKDNDQGYTLDNMCKACWTCNVTKGCNLTSDEMKVIGPNLRNRIEDLLK